MRGEIMWKKRAGIIAIVICILAGCILLLPFPRRVNETFHEVSGGTGMEMKLEGWVWYRLLQDPKISATVTLTSPRKEDGEPWSVKLMEKMIIPPGANWMYMTYWRYDETIGSYGSLISGQLWIEEQEGQYRLWIEEWDYKKDESIIVSPIFEP